MPTRRKQAYSFLEKASKLAGSSAAPGSILANYQAFKAGTRTKNKQSSQPALTPQQRIRDAIALAPFNKPVVAGAAGRYEATITRLSSTQRTALGLSDAELGYTGTAGVTSSSDYFPAMLRASVRTGVATQKTSGITGRSYSYRDGRVYSFPFGRTTASAATDSEEGRRAVLVNEMKGSTTPPTSIGYEPEVWRYDAGASAGDLDGVPAPA